MSKLDRIRHFLNENKAEDSYCFDPVTCQLSLLGFDCDPHERQMLLFVYENREPAPLLFLLLRLHVPLLYSDFPVFWICGFWKIHGKNQSWPSKYRQPYDLCRV